MAGESYRGETSFPFILQNVHRYFFYLAVVYLVLPLVRRDRGLLFADGFGIGVGSIIMLVNMILLDYLHRCPAIRCATWSAGSSIAFPAPHLAPSRHTGWSGSPSSTSTTCSLPG